MPHFLALKTCVLASILLAFPYSACFAEVLELVGGARIEGTWKNPSDTTSQEYLFETTDGVTLRRRSWRLCLGSVAHRRMLGWAADVDQQRLLATRDALMEVGRSNRGRAHVVIR